VVNTVEASALPYISMHDLIVFKINSCGMRGTLKKKERDAGDAEALLDLVADSRAFCLTLNQHNTRNVLLIGLKDVVALTSHPEAWWKRKLGL